MAQTSLLLLLFAFFRRSERWLHQHLLKVGWLLTHNRNTAFVFYFTVFLPGIALHEACRWLAASLLKARSPQAERLLLPKEDQLSLVRIAPGAGALKRIAIEASPVIAALAALWLIAINFLGIDSALRITAPGNVSDLARALASLLAQPDFGLWFYLMFTIANTMLPPISRSIRARSRLIAGAILAVTFIIAVIIGLGGDSEALASIGSLGSGLLSSLMFILAATTIINLVMALVLGLIEAGIERVTGHSASFLDGDFITETRQQAQAARSAREYEHKATRTANAADIPEQALRSIYALKLPIPGAPGIEPVSKPVAAVLEQSPKRESKRNVAPREKPAATFVSSSPSTRRRASARSQKAPETVAGTSKRAAFNSNNKVGGGKPVAEGDENKERSDSSAEPPLPENKEHDTRLPTELAPFSRPFSQAGAAHEVFHDWDDSDDDQAKLATDLGFSRPFAPPGTPADKSSKDVLPSADKKSKTTAPKPVAGPARAITRPVPKPSQGDKKQIKNADSAADENELRYEPFEDEFYDDGGDFDEPSS